MVADKILSELDRHSGLSIFTKYYFSNGLTIEKGFAFTFSGESTDQVGFITVSI